MKSSVFDAVTPGYFILSILLLLFIGSGFFFCSKSTVLIKGHSHNDYEHDHPLFDALAQGFTSIEADIHLVNGNLYVAHDKEDIDSNRTIQTMYLEPLRHRIEKNGGYVYKNKTPVTLLVDIKSEADSTYLALRDVLKQYIDLLTVYRNDEPIQGAVNVIISGNRSIEIMRREKYRYASYDGRLSDLDSKLPNTLVPLISDNWTKQFKWQGKGDFPQTEKIKLYNIVKKAHAGGRQVRFWATDVDSLPYQKNLWNELLKADVDVLNTDKLSELRMFLKEFSGE